MESAVCTEKGASGADPMHKLAPAVQVRPEDSGLLFYHSKGPRLYFLNSGSLIRPDYFGSGIGLKKWLETNGIERSEIHAKLATALDDLVKKEVLVC